MDASLQMWAVLLIAVAVLVLFVTEWLSVELTSIGLLTALLLLFHAFPLPGHGTEELLAGFGNSALITVMALLVLGEGLVMTGALDRVAAGLARLPMPPASAVAVALVGVAVVSGVLNNTPVVVIFIPILQALAGRLGLVASRLMMPLSFAAILGGMLTLIGSSTNLLVSSALITMGQPPLGFFEFTVLGSIMAAVGLVYVVVAVPRLLPDRTSMVASFGAGKQFVSQCVVPADSPLVGETAVAGQFRALPGVTVQMIERAGRLELPPFDNVALRPGDMLVLAAPRAALQEAAVRHPGLLHPPRRNGVDDARSRAAESKRAPATPADPDASELVLAEVMVTPVSRLVGFNILQIGFRRTYGAVVLGIQRRARMLRGRMDMIRLEPGDVLLVHGSAADVEALQRDRDMVVISGSSGVLPKPHHARSAALIFVVTVTVAALGLVPIVIAALAAVTAMIASRAINIRQAARALDRKVLLLVAASLALGGSMQATGGAAWIAHGFIGALPDDLGLYGVLSAFFLLVAVMTNLLSNNACAVLFTPIGISLAAQVGGEAHMFAIATLLAANCSFATPIGYQTNLLVMGPGHYRFADFVRAGLPLTLLMWLVFSLAAPVVWG